MARLISNSDTLTFIPSSFDDTNSTYNGVYNNYNPTNGLTDHNSSTRVCVYANTGSGAESNLWYNFDCSEIPNGATIESVSCQAGASCYSNGQYFATRTLQLYVGTSTAKGSATTITGNGSTKATHTLTCGSNWTRNDLNNLKLRIHIVRTTSNTTTQASFSFWGATLTIAYSVDGYMYTIAASSSVSGITVDPASQEIFQGGNGIVNIYANSLEDISITDNDNDISNLLVQKTVPTGGTISAVPASYTTSGSISGTRYRSTVGCGVSNPSSQTGNDYCSSNGSTATIYYTFNFDDIPDNATISSMTVQAIGHLENASQSSEVARLNTYYGTTAKGTQVSYTSTSNTTLTISPGTWTVAELKSDARVGFTIGYYGGLTTGITWTVEYSIPNSGNNVYYEYTISNIAADHVILIEEAGAFIPPEEDPQKTYYPITISSINAATTPGSGTTRIEAGTSETITIHPSDPLLTLALDNGVDVTNQLVGGAPTNTYTVTTQVSGASYGFNLNSGTGYYVSTNNGVSKSASVARLNMNFESSCLVTIQYINYAEATYDYGLFGKLDTTIATDGLTAASGGSNPSDSSSNYQLMCNTSAYNMSTAQTISYEVPAGEHFIDIKYGKDDASDLNNDTLQWKVLSIEATGTGGDYTYTLSNINQSHSLIFVFGNVSYYFVTSSGSNAKLYPEGQMVRLAGDNYKLTIIPDDYNATVTLLDNNNNVTNLLETETGVDKYNNPVINYVYRLSNIAATHTLTASCISSANSTLYMKVNNTWTQYRKVYVKTNGSWVEQNMSNWGTILTNGLEYKLNS